MVEDQAGCQVNFWAIVIAKNADAFLVKEIREFAGFLCRNKLVGLFRSQRRCLGSLGR
jgi:hypothetical protein